MICGFCRYKSEEEITVCPKCGAPMEKEITQPVVEPVQPIVQPVYQQPVYQQPVQYTKENKGKGKMIIPIVLLIILIITAIGYFKPFNGMFSSKSSFITYYKDSKVLDKYETKKLMDGVTYKEITWHEQCLGTDCLILSIVIYNDTDIPYVFSGTVQGYIGEEENNQHSQGAMETVLPHSASTMEFAFFNADSYKIERLYDYGKAKENEVIKNDAYSYSSYKLDLEKKDFKIYFKYNGNGKNSTEFKIYGVKDGKIAGEFETFTSLATEDGRYSSEETSKKGDMAQIWLYDKDFSKYDSFIYFYSGRLK